MKEYDPSDEERLKKLADKGWTLHFYFSYDGWNFSGATAGDCNCGHRKEYDQSDGHGFSIIDEGDICFDGIPNWTPMDWWLDRIEEKVAEIVPGEQWPDRPQEPEKTPKRWCLPWFK